MKERNKESIHQFINSSIHRKMKVLMNDKRTKINNYVYMYINLSHTFRLMALRQAG